MKILFLDLASNGQTSGNEACIACVSDKKTEALHAVDHRMADDQLLPALDATLKKAGWVPNDLTHIACVTGPGGFTSLRVAVTLANTYGDQLQIPMTNVHLSDLYHARFNSDAVWIHSTKKSQVFVRGFGSHAFLWPEPTLLSIEDLAVALPSGASVIGELLLEHREAIAAKQPIYPEISPIAEILPDFLAPLTYTHEALVPWYGRGW